MTESSIIRHLENEKEIGAEIRPAIVPGIVTRDAHVSYWPIFFSLSLLRDGPLENLWGGGGGGGRAKYQKNIRAREN